MSANPASPDRRTGTEPSSDGGQAACRLPSAPDLSGVTVVPLRPQTSLADYLAAMQRANAEAGVRPNDPMLLSWYDRDRDFEAPPHVSEYHQDSAVSGYVDYEFTTLPPSWGTWRTGGLCFSTGRWI